MGFFGETFKYLKLSYSVQIGEFFENSSLHGVKYIAATDRPVFERFMWFVCVTLGTVAACVVIFSLLDKFQTNPTITGLDTDFHNWHVSFPAVALCPQGPVDPKTILTLLSDELHTADIEFYQDFIQLSMNNLEVFSKKYQSRTDLNFTDLRQLAFKLIDRCENLFESCQFKGEIINCCNGILLPVLTENGACYTFNSKHSIEDFRHANHFNMQYIEETDIKWSFEFSINRSGKLIEETSPFALYIWSSDEMLGLEVQPQLIWDFKVDRVSFSFKQTYTTEDTRQFSIKQRRCVFEDEIKVLLDSIYTYTACTTQCRMETMRSVCNCVIHFYPRTPGFEYCNLTGLYCVSERLKDIMDVGTKCDCQLGCRNTVYEVETLNSKAISSNFVNRIEIGFVSWPMVRYKREVLFGWVDLLVSFGGIAGLFLGFSILSGVEIFYYFTIRAWIAAFNERKFLNKIHQESLAKHQKEYDLSLVPYFIAKPLPGGGFDTVAKRLRNRKVPILTTRNNKVHVERIPPFGLEFVN